MKPSSPKRKADEPKKKKKSDSAEDTYDEEYRLKRSKAKQFYSFVNNKSSTKNLRAQGLFHRVMTADEESPDVNLDE